MQAAKYAIFTIESKVSRTHVSLSQDLGHVHSNSTPFPHPHPRNGPSQQKRCARHEEARSKAEPSAGKTDLNQHVVSTAGKVIEITSARITEKLNTAVKVKK